MSYPIPISVDMWEPVGVPFLESAATSAIKDSNSVSVVAGPGAGKTEFLAQKAAFLFQTARCPAPYKILAISLKRDAAENLAKRVRARLPKAYSDRFTSLTFDAFTKGLVDRFRSGLPQHLRPTNYDVLFTTKRYLDQYIGSVTQTAPSTWQFELGSTQGLWFEQRELGTFRLPSNPIDPADATQYLIMRWWHDHVAPSGSSRISFIMFNRLAELIVRTNPQVLRALRATYPVVFLDEFQDTTHAQYDFMVSALLESSSVLTAVGDDKQRIMKWAGARVDAFDEFAADFEATRYPLVFNFRSSPGLVELQRVVSLALSDESPHVESQVAPKIVGDVAEIWSFTSKGAEADKVSQWISQDMTLRKLTPNDYCLLVRQKANDFEVDLKTHFDAVGLNLLNESRLVAGLALQDLRVDPLAKFTAGVLRLATRTRDAEAWATCRDMYFLVLDVESEDAASCAQAETRLQQFVSEVKINSCASAPSAEGVDSVFEAVLAFLGEARLRQTVLDYANEDNYNLSREATREHLRNSGVDVESWETAVKAFEGSDSISLMTVHKSKGLEFDTVIVLALDNDMWWSHKQDAEESTATFFVALSRAKQKIVLTTCAQRGGTVDIADLYGYLSAAGVTRLDF